MAEVSRIGHYRRGELLCFPTTYMMMRLTYEIELSLHSRAPFPDFHLPKALRTQQCFNIFKWKSSSRCSLVHILSTSSSKSAPSPALFFLTMFMWNRALATVLRASCRPHLQKVLRGPQFLTIFCEIELSLQLQSCAHFVGHLSRSSRETAETETLLRRPRQPLYPKK